MWRKTRGRAGLQRPGLTLDLPCAGWAVSGKLPALSVPALVHWHQVTGACQPVRVRGGARCSPAAASRVLISGEARSARAARDTPAVGRRRQVSLGRAWLEPGALAGRRFGPEPGLGSPSAPGSPGTGGPPGPGAPGGRLASPGQRGHWPEGSPGAPGGGERGCRGLRDGRGQIGAGGGRRGTWRRTEPVGAGPGAGPDGAGPRPGETPGPRAARAARVKARAPRAGRARRGLAESSGAGRGAGRGGRAAARRLAGSCAGRGARRARRSLRES